MRTGDKIIVNIGAVVLEHLDTVTKITLECKSGVNEYTARHLARSILSNIIGAIADDTISDNMNWVKDVNSCYPEKYLTHVPFNCGDRMLIVIGYLIEDIYPLVQSGLDLPTWFMLRVVLRGRSLLIEVGDDFRIYDWMNNHSRNFQRRNKGSFKTDGFFKQDSHKGGYR